MNKLSVCLIFFACSILFCYGQLAKDPLSKHEEALLQSLKKYEIVFPVQYADYDLQVKKPSIATQLNKNTGTHDEKVYITMKFEGKEYVIDLIINEMLLPSSFSIAKYTESGEITMHKPTREEMNHCYYHGRVRGIDSSLVTMTTCDGLRGQIFLPGDLFIIEPITNQSNLSSEYQHYVIYRPVDIKDRVEGFCGNDHGDANQHLSDLARANFSSEFLGKNSSRSKRNTGSETLFVQLLMVADFEEVSRYGNEVIPRIMQIVNIADAYYLQFSIRIILSHIELWNRENLISDSTDSDTIIDEFRKFRQERMSQESDSSPWVYTDNVQLVFGADLIGSTIGVAYLEGMCNSLSVGVVQDYASNVLFPATVLTHEMGHNFGMHHDGSGCTCANGTQCIMSASVGSIPPSFSWSDCSYFDLIRNFELGTRSCLVDVPDPSRIFGDSICGNEVIEEGEECDCGLFYICTSQCCNPNTCQLLPGAQCDCGGCCSDCQFVTAGTECRGTDNECDLSEYCTGTSENCPSNGYIEDGARCLSDTATCFEGVCLTRDIQCQMLWGEDSSSGPDYCYSLINVLGNEAGNCGVEADGSYIPCSSSHVSCGKLACVGGLSIPLRGQRWTTYTIGGVTECNFIWTLDNTDARDEFLVRVGTMCGDERVCMDGVCSSFPVLTCPDQCNGNGVCNNLGNCHCNYGWNPPFCDTAGMGGSIDSGIPQGPAFTTAAPVVTTAEPAITTATPVVTTGTARPAVTTATPVVTTAGQAVTTEVVTTAGPAVTTATPVVSTAGPAFTTAAPVVTTAGPAVTTAVITTAGPAVTTATPVVTNSEPDVTTAIPVVTTAGPAVTPAVATTTPVETTTSDGNGAAPTIRLKHLFAFVVLTWFTTVCLVL